MLEDETMYLSPMDKRAKRFATYKKKHSFSPDELWNLDVTIASFALPRLKEFRKICSSDIITEVDKIIKAFELLIVDNYPKCDEEEAIIKNGLKAFANIFQGLWC